MENKSIMYKMLRGIWHHIPKRPKKRMLDWKVYISYKSRIRKFYKTIDLDNMPVFKAIEIETLNRCNGKCAFCPVNVNQKQRPYAKMTEELFYKLIGDLERINYNGIVSLYSNNEPFLDERMPEFLKYAREHLPNAFHQIYTNGTMLTLKLFDQVIPYIDRMVLDNYSDGIKIPPKLMALKKHIDSGDNKDKVVFAMRIEDEVMTSRGGQAPNKKKAKAVSHGCILPFQQMVIRPTGKVSLCCNDALGIYTLGDANRDFILDIWNSDRYNSIRKEHIKNKRKRLKLCKACDTQIWI